jgi:serine/threonine protein phosphatase 1
MQTLVIGDIHGCWPELQALLDKAGLGAGDSIIALGDVVDRGPETPEVLEFFRRQATARSLMGNHERKHIRGARHEVRLAQSQKIARLQLGEAYLGALAFMETFPLYLELPEALLVHGYLEPGVPMEEQRDTVLCGTMGGDKYLREHYTRPWYELYAGEKPVIVGHLDYCRKGEAFIYQDLVYGLDTSCVHGKVLTGLLLPGFQVLSVPSRGNLWRQLQKEYRPLINPPRPEGWQPRRKPTRPWDEPAEKALEQIVAYALRESERVLAELRLHGGYDDLTPRQQARAFEAAFGAAIGEVREPLLVNLLHLARRGELILEKAREVAYDAGRVLEAARLVQGG